MRLSVPNHCYSYYLESTPTSRNEKRTQHRHCRYNDQHDEEVRLAREWLKNASLPLPVIVPRHRERTSGTLQVLRAETDQHIAQRRLGELSNPRDKLYLADTSVNYMVATPMVKAAFVGRSLIERGGHNMLEPVRLGVPVVVGSHTGNFEDVMQMMLETQSISVCHDERELTSMLKSAAEDKPPYSDTTRNAAALANSLTGFGDLYLSVLTG